MMKQKKVMALFILLISVTLFFTFQETQHPQRTARIPSSLPRQKNKLPSPSTSSSAEKKVVSHQLNKKIFPYLQQRQLIGIEEKQFASPQFQANIRFLNRVNPRWKKSLVKDLKRFSPKGTVVIFEKKASLLKITTSENRHQGQFIEQVIITTKHPKGRSYSFSANVDSETGHILQTWDKTIHDWPPQRDFFSPSGTL